MCDVGVDVWAAGCTAFELATGRFLFQPKVGGALVKVAVVQNCWNHVRFMLDLLPSFRFIRSGARTKITCAL